MGQPRRAIEYYEQHLVIAREIGGRRGESRSLNNLGMAYKDLGEPRPTVELCEQSLVIKREIGDRRGEGNALDNLGLACADLGDTPRAIALLNEALVIYEVIESPYAADTRATIVKLEQKGGN